MNDNKLSTVIAPYKCLVFPTNLTIIGHAPLQIALMDSAIILIRVRDISNLPLTTKLQSSHSRLQHKSLQ